MITYLSRHFKTCPNVPVPKISDILSEKKKRNHIKLFQPSSPCFLIYYLFDTKFQHTWFFSTLQIVVHFNSSSSRESLVKSNEFFPIYNGK